jgi:hypothetical protein
MKANEDKQVEVRIYASECKWMQTCECTQANATKLMQSNTTKWRQSSEFNLLYEIE